MKLPAVISPCPIVECTFGIRFDPTCPDDAVFGILYNNINEISGKTYKVENLPIQQLPPQIRNIDAALRYNPHYKLVSDNEVIFIGPHVLSVSNTGEYPGWGSFYKRIIAVVNLIKDSPIIGIDNVVRIGLRYVNFLAETNIFEKASIKLTSDGNSLDGEQLNITINSEETNTKTRTLVSNTAQTQNNLSIGSVVDIDVECSLEFFKADFENAINEIHEIEKQKFFALIGNEYLKEFNPEY